MLRTGNKMALAHIGDSRGYLLRDGTLTQITQRPLLRAAACSTRAGSRAEEAEHHPQRSLVTRVLTGHDGRRARPVDARGRVPATATSSAPTACPTSSAADTIEEILTEGLGTAATAERLIEIALRAGTRDNVTVIVGDVVDLGTGDAPSTAPEVVGAAADRRSPATQAIPTSPAEKAAALSRDRRRRGPRTTATRSSSPRAARRRPG